MIFENGLYIGKLHDQTPLYHYIVGFAKQKTIGIKISYTFQIGFIGFTTANVVPPLLYVYRGIFLTNLSETPGRHGKLSMEQRAFVVSMIFTFEKYTFQP